MSIGVRRRPAVERPRSLQRQLRRPSLCLPAKRLARLPKSCTAVWLGFGPGAPWRPYLLSMQRFRLFARGAPGNWLCRAGALYQWKMVRGPLASHQGARVARPLSALLRLVLYPILWAWWRLDSSTLRSRAAEAPISATMRSPRIIGLFLSPLGILQGFSSPTLGLLRHRPGSRGARITSHEPTTPLWPASAR